jgi:hypothetical protein
MNELEQATHLVQLKQGGSNGTYLGGMLRRKNLIFKKYKQ